MTNMDRNVVGDAVKTMNLALRLERKIIGVRLLFEPESFDGADAKAVKGRMPYCVMVRNAMAGKKLKAAAPNFGCMGGAKALGIVELDEHSTSGRFYESLRLYGDLITARNVQRTMTFCGHKLYGVMVKPLEEYEEAPDVVLIVTNPYNTMRIIQGYTYAFGYNTGFRMSGNQAICSECTAYPLESNDINVSPLCSGTRFKAQWRDDEMATGFPFNRFLAIAAGINATLDLVEPNEKKAEIEERYREAGEVLPVVHYDRNYYTGLNPE